MMTSEKIRVWDSFIRIFHWSLALAFVLAYLTEGEVFLHFYAGYFIAFLLVLRIIWGFVGTKHARFKDFIKTPSTTITYAKMLINPKLSLTPYIGHNPLGGAMVIALLVALTGTVASGVKLYTEQGYTLTAFIGESPLAEVDTEHSQPSSNMLVGDENKLDKTEDTSEESEYDDDRQENDSGVSWKEVHELFVNITFLLVIVHIFGVFISSRREGENLAKAMITGKKNR
jgi:cytochrome b